MPRDFKSLRRYSGKNTNAEEAENVNFLNRRTSTDPLRPPLNAIQEPFRVPKGIPNQEMSSFKTKRVDRTPIKPMPNHSDKSMPLSTPNKRRMTLNNQFSWAQKSEYSSTNSFVKSKEAERVVSTMKAPSSTRAVTKANLSYNEYNWTQNTPIKSVSKPPNPGFTSGSRSVIKAGSGMTNCAAMSKGVPSSCNFSTVVDTAVVPYFELKDDPSFWMEHNVQVLIRIRPPNNMEKSSFGFSRCLKQESEQNVTWIGHPETRFMFDHVACEAIDQETLFRTVGLPMVENCLAGYNSCMFAYGQTGSGKTYTMIGELEVESGPNRGMIPRIFEFLFTRIRAEEESRRDEQLKYNCRCSFLEIYNEQITDLLHPSSTNLLLREDMQKGVYVENLSEFDVYSSGDILQLLNQGSSNRKVAVTKMNGESSRSHSVFTCVVESRWVKDSTTNLRFARLNLVDLAGSERQKSSGAEGERLKEAATINKSLSTLGHVIMVLVDVAQGKPRHVPYRDSRLTFLLQDSLGGNSKTMIIANVSPSICSAAETLNTLKFAQRAKLIKNNAIVNEDSSGDVIALKHQIQLLKEELSALKREKVYRSSSFGPVINLDTRNKHEDGFNERSTAQEELLKSLEATLVDSLRREQIAETSIKQLEVEIEQLNRLVGQREEETKCTKMILKFREDKIRRMESVIGGLMPGDAYLLDEKNALVEEIELLRARIDKNPEVTRFALENIRLSEEVRRFQDMYEEGGRELLMTEVSDMRNQLLSFLGGNLKKINHLDTKDSNHGDNDLLHQELMRTLSELEETRSKLNFCLEENAKLRREVQELRLPSLNVLASAAQDHDCDAEVIKESIVEVAFLSNQSIMTTQREKEGIRCGDLMTNAEDIMDSQLEMDILKVILREERSRHAETEGMATFINRELQLSKEKAFHISKEYEKVQEELRNAKLIIEALKPQQMQSTNEKEDVKTCNVHYDELLKAKELEISYLEEQTQCHEPRDFLLCKHSDSEDSTLEAKLKKMHKSLKKAKRLNKWYQNDLASHEEIEEVQKQVEAETVEVIVCLQNELSGLRQEVLDSKLKEMQTRDRLAQVQKQLIITEDKIRLRSEDNVKLAEMLEDKDKQLRILTEEWDLIANEIEGILSGGHDALKDVSEQTGIISSSTPHKKNWMSEQFGKMKKYIFEKEFLTEELNRCLKDALDRRDDLECRLRSLRGAALVMTETYQQQCIEKDKEILRLASDLNNKTSTVAELQSLAMRGQDQLKVASSCATAAFVIVDRLWELNSSKLDALNDKEVQFREFKEIITQKDSILQNQASVINEAYIQIHSLQRKLEASEEYCTKLRLELSKEQNHLVAL